MKLLLNDKEIARFLIELVNVFDACKHIEFDERHTAGMIHWVIETKNKPKVKPNIAPPAKVNIVAPGKESAVETI